MEAANPSQTASVGVAVAVLAAGSGTRFNSSIPKHLHPVAGVPIVERVIRAGLAIEPDRLVAVVSPAMEELPSMLGMDGLFATTVQDDPQGTAAAVRHALDAIGDCEWLVSLLGDNPLLTGDMIRDLVHGARDTGARIGVLTAITAREKYGRIDRENDNIVRIVEHKNDRPDDPDWHKGIEEINSGIMVLDAPWAREALARVERDHETKEFLLTDLIALAVAEHDGTGSWPVQSVTVDEHVAVGVNNRSQQASASSIEFDKKRASLMVEGVSFIGPESSFIEKSAQIGQDTTILPGCYITGNTVIGANCVIGPHAVIHNSSIGNDVEIASSTVTDSTVESGSSVGPYARLRNGAAIGPDVHIGNFVEVKNSGLGAGTKAGHHAYLGDATVGERVNIGAGVITANFDGVDKHRTEIGDDAFIGSDTVLVAPRTVGERGRTGAGSVVTHDVAPDTLVVGVPARPRTTGGGSQS